MSPSTAAWNLVVIAGTIALSAWFPAVMLALSTGPAQKGDPSPSLSERMAGRLFSRSASALTNSPSEPLRAGPTWNRFVEHHWAAAERLRRGNDGLFLPARLLAWAVTLCSLVQLLCELSALVLRTADAPSLALSLAIALGGFLPVVLTLQVSRMKWRRRAPFEHRILLEGASMLQTCNCIDGDDRGINRARALTELDDLLAVARSRFRFEGTTASLTAAKQQWRAAMIPSLQEATRERLKSSVWDEAAPHLWAARHLERLIRAVTTPPHAVSAPLDNLHPTTGQWVPRFEYSADRAAATLIVFLGIVTAVFASIAHLEASPETFSISPSWSAIETVLRLVALVVSLAAAGVALVRNLTRAT